jgi:di/tricarboxylate transporter
MAAKTLKEMFFWPTVIGFFTLTGLIVALVMDGLLEDLSLVALSLPIVVIFYIYFFRH